MSPRRSKVGASIPRAVTHHHDGIEIAWRPAPGLRVRMFLFEHRDVVTGRPVEPDAGIAVERLTDSGQISSIVSIAAVDVGVFAGVITQASTALVDALKERTER